ncbi:MAG: uncharacterized membrane protein YgdD (TMEM256/DUF423 family) [Planctomycetota bacterium]|jgi:uncharacterized membrane protein YgdD (TMEM256/DUF423 family)
MVSERLMDRLLLRLTGLNGFLAVAMGAFGAHGLKGMLESHEDALLRLSWWETASHYHLSHALALGLCAWLSGAVGGRSRAAGYCFQIGILLFSGSLYLMTLTGLRALGMVTPIGGLFLLAGWALIFFTAGNSRPKSE